MIALDLAAVALGAMPRSSRPRRHAHVAGALGLVSSQTSGKHARTRVDEPQAQEVPHHVDQEKDADAEMNQLLSGLSVEIGQHEAGFVHEGGGDQNDDGGEGSAIVPRLGQQPVFPEGCHRSSASRSAPAAAAVNISCDVINNIN